MANMFLGKKRIDEVLDEVHNLSGPAELAVDYSLIVVKEKRKWYTLWLIKHDMWYLRIALMLNGKRVAERCKVGSLMSCLMARNSYWGEVWSWAESIKEEHPGKINIVGDEDDEPWEEEE